MKLSEAMMLGSATCKMYPGNWNSCALGAAANAVGIPAKYANDPGPPRCVSILNYWPWLDTSHDYPGSPPWGGIIASRFDYQVCRGTMTYEQLVDYVRAVEPECGECCKFKCTCELSSPVGGSLKKGRVGFGSPPRPALTKSHERTSYAE
jgi:hypothetical protein